MRVRGSILTLGINSMKKLLLLAAGLIATSTTPAMAQNSGLETHVGISMYENNDFTGVQARLGYIHDLGNFSIGIEGEGGSAFTEISETINDPQLGTVGVDLTMDSNLGIYGVARTNRDSQFGIIGRLGYHSTTFGGTVTNGNIGSISTDLSANGFAGGIGVDYAFGNDRRNVVRFDATYMDLGDLAIDDGMTVLALSYGRRF